MRHRLGVIWDLDGTMVDTGELHYEAWVRLAAELRLPFTRDDFAATFGWRNTEIIPRLFGIADPPRVLELSEWKETSYRAEAEKGVELLPGVRALLAGLAANGHGQGVGSSAPRGNLDLLLDITQINQFFGAVIGMEDTQRGKPDPEVFLLAAEALGISPAQCAVVEDAPAGIMAAKAAGMRAIGVTVAGHHGADELYGVGADLVVPTLEEVDAAAVGRLIAGARESTG